MGAITSVSISPFATSVEPVATRSTMSARQPEARRQFHRPAELHHLRLDAARGVMAAGDVRILRRHAHARPRARVIAAGGGGGLRHRDPAGADAEIERRVDFRIVELHQHVGAADAELGGAERDEGGDIERPHPHDLQPRIVGGEAQAAAVLIDVVRRRGDAGAREQRAALLQDAAFREREHDRRGGIGLQGGGWREGGHGAGALHRRGRGGKGGRARPVGNVGIPLLC